MQNHFDHKLVFSRKLISSAVPDSYHPRHGITAIDTKPYIYYNIII